MENRPGICSVPGAQALRNRDVSIRHHRLTVRTNAVALLLAAGVYETEQAQIGRCRLHSACVPQAPCLLVER